MNIRPVFIRLCAVVTMVFVLFTTISLADMPKSADQIIVHLEFLGYKIKKTDELIIVEHEKKFNFHIAKFQTGEGIIFIKFLRGTANAKKDRIGYLEFGVSA